MAEAYRYRREDILDENGNVVDTALFRVPNPSANRGGESGNGGYSGYVAGSANNVSASRGIDWTNAEYRGASAGGRVRQYIRSAAGRGAARNPVMRNNRYGI